MSHQNEGQLFSDLNFTCIVKLINIIQVVMGFMHIAWVNIVYGKPYSGRSEKNKEWQAPTPTLHIQFQASSNNSETAVE